MWFIFKLSAFRSKERREICACNRCRVIVVKIISLCYIISLFLYLLRVRFGNRVWLKPREKQVPAAPKSLKANVDKPQLKYKAVWRENVHNGIQRKFLLKRFCLRPLSILYFILHFSVNKAFFTFITLKFLSKKKFCGSMLYTLVIL